MLRITLVALVTVCLSSFGDVDAWPGAGTCLCVTSALYVRNSACGSKQRVVVNGQCFKATGRYNGCSFSSGGTWYTYLEANVNGRNGWMASNYLKISLASLCGVTSGVGCSGVTIVPRSSWGARSARSITTLSTPVPKVFIHHTVTGSSYGHSACSSSVKSMQNNHMDTRGWSDIGFNFLICEDGKAYEGRGWTRVGFHVFGHDSQSIGIAMIGTFTSRAPNAAALNAAKNLIACGVEKGYVKTDYKLHGHRDGGSTACPGNSLYGVIQNWPRYSSRV